MSLARVTALTTMTMTAFAGNSLLCHVASKQTNIDPATFTTVRVVSGAAMLWLIASMIRTNNNGRGNWVSGFSLFVYAAAFSFAYVSLPASIGALLLFGAVQATMTGYGIWKGERLTGVQLAGILLALGGLVGLLSPGFSAPPLTGSFLMVCAGIAWGIYSLRGKGKGDPIRVTAGNFLLAAPFAVVLTLLMFDRATPDSTGLWYAVLSGAVASGMGYAVWYTVLPALKATTAATVQLSVPVIAALGGIAFLGEPLTLRLVLASIVILGGIALVSSRKNRV